MPWLFLSERGYPLTRQAVNDLLALAAKAAGLAPVHPHVLRASVGSRGMRNLSFSTKIVSAATEGFTRPGQPHLMDQSLALPLPQCGWYQHVIRGTCDEL